MSASKAPLYPFVFGSILKEVVWGGRRLASMEKVLPVAKAIGESWELVDLSTDQSVVVDGPLRGTDLETLITRYRSSLMGPVKLDSGRFPLLVKYIDAKRTLSVQVHPDATVARKLLGRPKSEAWYILDADPDSVLWLGLQDGVTSDALRSAVASGVASDVESLLRSVSAKPGQLVPVRPGTVHAIGGGVLLAEVQQPSDTTYRLYDWGRMDVDGKPRALHLDEAIQSIDYGAHVRLSDTAYDAEHFQIVVHDVTRQLSLETPGPIVVVGLAGECDLIASGHENRRVAVGSVVLLPHAVRPVSIGLPDPSAVSSGVPPRVMIVTFPS